MNIEKVSARRLVASCLMGIVTGFILIIVPIILHGEPTQSLFGLVDSSVKNMSTLHLLFLLMGGFCWGLLLSWPYSLFAAICQVGSLPIFAIIEMFMDSRSHSLWPFEFMIYAALTLVPILGLSAASLLKRAVHSRGAIQR